jgi:hypothetical protein
MPFRFVTFVTYLVNKLMSAAPTNFQRSENEASIAIDLSASVKQSAYSQSFYGIAIPLAPRIFLVT